MLKNGRPYTIMEFGFVDDELLTDCTQEEQKVVLNWIRENFIPSEKHYRNITSYSLKHALEHSTGIYLTNNQFKDAMMMCGYNPVDCNWLNWEYCISKKSPALNLPTRYYV